MEYIFVLVLALVSQIGLNFVSDKIGYGYRSLHKYLAIGINGVAWILLFERFSWSPTFVVLGLATSILLSSSFIDLKYQEIPDSYNVAVAVLGGVFVFLYQDYYQQLLLGGLIAFLLFLAIMVLTGAMGGGDVKLAGALGLFMGTGLVMKFIMYSFFSGALVAILLLLLKKKGKSDVFPFGPSIAFSGIYLFIFFV
jgi:leader peptidase (prepilin peptidase)/N-methyltransferase